jgi:hypothetical protein
MRMDEERKAVRKREATPADERSDRGEDPVEFGPERFANGRINRRRERALERHARFVYEYDRD